MATYFWVGGSGTWDNSSTTNWATSTGGAGGFGPPITGDTVNFDSNSGTAATVTVASTAACTTCVINKSDINLSLSGNVTFAGTTTFTAGTITLNNNAFTAAFFSSNNSNARSIAFGTGQINLTGNGGTVWGLATATNFSYTGTPTVNFTYAGSTGSRTINHGGTAGGTEANAVNLNVTAGSDGFNFSNASHVKSVNFTGFSGTLTNFFFYLYGDVTLSSGMTLNAGANQVNFSATSGTQRITSNGKTFDFPINFEGVGGTYQLQDNMTVGTTRTVTLNNGTLDLTGNSGNWTLATGLFLSQSATTRSIVFGTGKIAAAGNSATVFSTRNITNFSCTGSKRVELTYAGSTGTRTVRSGDLGGTATANNTVDIFITAGSDTVDFFTNATTTAVRSLDTTGFSGTISTNAFRLFGSLTLSATTVFTGTANAISFISTSAGNTITTNGVTVDRALTFNGIGGSWAFQDALTQGSTRAFTITNGTVQLKAGATSTVGSFVTSGTNQKFLESTLAGTQATLSDASGTNTLTYTTIKDIAATGGATWQAYVTSNNVNAENNTGWDFYLPVNSIFDSLRLRGYTGTVTDMLLQYYKANGAVSNSLQDAESEFLILKGFTTGTNTDKWFNYLRSLSYTGSINDMLFDYWKDPA
jgi:lipopolysaccharide export system protein LptA